MQSTKRIIVSHIG